MSQMLPVEDDNKSSNSSFDSDELEKDDKDFQEDADEVDYKDDEKDLKVLEKENAVRQLIHRGKFKEECLHLSPCGRFVVATNSNFLHVSYILVLSAKTCRVIKQIYISGTI